MNLLLSALMVATANSLLNDDDWIVTETEKVLDYKNNPILRPTEPLEWLLGDPTVVLIEETQEIHMFVNEVFHGILHFSANYSQPTELTKQGTVIGFPGSVRPYVMRDGDRLHLYYEQYHLPLYRRSSIMLRSADIIFKQTGSKEEKYISTCQEENSLFSGSEFQWDSQSSEVLRPELDWERKGTERVGNPFVVFSPGAQDYLLYYSASSVHLNDSKIDEPLYLGLARAVSPQGPWTRVSDRPLALDNEDIGDRRILGTGSLKFVKTAGLLEDDSPSLTALCNRVTLDSQERTGSTISLLESPDGGRTWRTTIGDLISPQVDTPQSWKRSYVYGFDTLLGRRQ